MNGKDYGMPHSSYYHRRYEGYTERLATDANGKRHIERVYTGEYYCQDAADNRRILVRILYAALYVLAAGLSIVLSSKSAGSNGAVYVQLITFLLVLALMVMLVNLVAYMAAPRRMTVWQHYAGPVRVKRWSGRTALLMAVDALAVLIYALVHQDAGLAGEWINATGLLGALAAMFLINRTEAGITYAKTLNQSEPPRDGYYIDS